MKHERIVGYVLLAIGVAMIFFATYQMVQVFTGASPPPDLFNFSDISFPTAGQEEDILLIAGKELNKLVAMGFWYMLMFFIMWAGGKIASLGVNLIKEIKFEGKEPAKKVEEKEAEKSEENQDSISKPKQMSLENEFSAKERV